MTFEKWLIMPLVMQKRFEMTERDKIGEGRAAVAAANEGVMVAVNKWRNATDVEKGQSAQEVLSHIGALPGMKLRNFVDEETAAQIRADFAARKTKKD